MTIDETILKEFGVIWPRHVSSLTQFLIDCRRHFDGDIDLFLVLCIIGDRTFSARHVPSGMSFDDWNSVRVDTIRSEDINVQSISDFSNIPRETVRRLRAILHQAAKTGLEAQNRDGHPDFANYVAGMLAWVRMVSPQQAEPLDAAWRRLRRDAAG